MATIKYRHRKAGSDEEWSGAVALWRIMRYVSRRQRRFGKPYRERKRDKPWHDWFTSARYFRKIFNSRLRLGEIGVYQYQVGGGGGPIFGVMKFKLPPRVLPIGERVLQIAYTCIGIPYGFGEANGPEDPGKDELDCSGLTQYSWGGVGVFLPHSSEMQRTAFNVSTFNQESMCIPGDLVLMNFPNSRGIAWPRASHVGLWVKPGWMFDTRSQKNPPALRPIERERVVCFGRPHTSQQR